jgi:hypothetical protein
MLLIHWHIGMSRLLHAYARTTIEQTARAAENGPQTLADSTKKQDGEMAVRAMVVRLFAYRSRHSAICQGTLPDTGMLQSGVKAES